MNSCLIEVLETAFGRFAELGACKEHVYDTQMGEKIVYIKVKPEITNKILEQLSQVLGSLSSVSLDALGEAAKGQQDQNMQVIEREIQDAIMTA